LLSKRTCGTEDIKKRPIKFISVKIFNSKKEQKMKATLIIVIIFVLLTASCGKDNSVNNEPNGALKIAETTNGTVTVP